MAFPKINVGKMTQKVNKFDLSHDSNGTADFGFLYPMTAISMIPNQSVKISALSEVTLSPLVVPTGGRINYRNMHVFVPYNDLLENFDSLIAGTEYRSRSTKYIPTSVPVISPHDLFCMLVRYSYMCTYIKSGSNDPISYEPTKWEIYDSSAKADFNNWQNISDPAGTNSTMHPITLLPARYFKHVLEGGTSLGILPSEADYIVQYSNNSDRVYTFCFKLTNVGKRIRKILLGLGYQIDPDDRTSKVSLMPIFAYCKAYFDLFTPQRDNTWLSSDVYTLLQRISQSGEYDESLSYGASLDFWELFVEKIFPSLADMYYTEDNNFVSAHIPTPSISPSLNISAHDPDSLSMLNYPASANHQITSQSTDSWIGMQLVKKVTQFQNISTALGKRVRELAIAITGSGDVHLPESNFIGATDLFVNIDPVFSTSVGEDLKLGDFAGKGFGRSTDSKYFSFKASTYGIWIAFACVVPFGHYFQGQAGYLYDKGRFDFYNGQFDGLGYEVTPKAMIMADNAVTKLNENTSNSAFGYIPRYTRLKQHGSIVNGDMSLRSTRSSLLPYTLDKFITPTDMTANAESVNVGSIQLSDVEWNVSNIPIASSQWRFVNRYSWLSNYNRIFAESGLEHNFYKPTEPYEISDDPMIIKNKITVESYAPMLSVSDSFDTDSFGDHISVEKA